MPLLVEHRLQVALPAVVQHEPPVGRLVADGRGPGRELAQQRDDGRPVEEAPERVGDQRREPAARVGRGLGGELAQQRDDGRLKRRQNASAIRAPASGACRRRRAVGEVREQRRELSDDAGERLHAEREQLSGIGAEDLDCVQTLSIDGETAQRRRGKAVHRSVRAITMTCYPRNDVDFEWQAWKAEANVEKHDIGFEEASTVFADPLARIFDDPDHSADESREIIVGHSMGQRLLIVSFTERGGRIRIISARASTRRERHGYEQGIGET